jgi:hypothetical protein
MHAVIGIATVLPSNWKASSRIPTRLDQSFIAREILSRETLAAVMGPNLFGPGLRSSCTNECDYTFALQEYSGWIPVFNSNPQTTTKLLEEHHLDRWSGTRRMILVIATITVIPMCYGKIKHVFHTVYHQHLSDRTGLSNTASLLSWLDTVQMPVAVVALRCAPPWLSAVTVGYLCSLLYLKTRYSDLHIFSTGFATLSMSSYVRYAFAWTPVVLGVVVNLPFMHSANREDRSANMWLTQIGVMSLLTHSVVFALYRRQREDLSISGIIAV